MVNGRFKNRISGENLPESLMQNELERLKSNQIIDRIWARDHTVWNENPDEISNRLGWLYSHRTMKNNLKMIYDLVDQVRAEGYTRALLLGMGGSSMAPEVFSKVFGLRQGYLNLDVLDSTDPGAILEKKKWVEQEKTLFIVSTKSGGTVETISLMKYFYNTVLKIGVGTEIGKHFIAITDPGSGLEKTAKELRFREIFLNDPEIGGRYSALSFFGLVPAALIGVDLDLLLDNADAMACNAEAPNCPVERENTPAWLGCALGVLGRNGHDKITLFLSPSIEPLGAWLEQLIAESTGKEGKGLLPVIGETVNAPESYANDRTFIYLKLNNNTLYDQDMTELRKAGHPVIQVNLQNKYSLGGEFFRWMMSTAVAGSIIGINPFDQPDVESAKIMAREVVSAYQEEGRLRSAEPDLIVNGIQVYSGSTPKDLRQAWREFNGKASQGMNGSKGRNYFAIQAYLKPDRDTDRALQSLRDKIQTLLQMAVTVGYGPRYLHSTGQLHKGDGGNGMFIQLTYDTPGDIPIPDQPGHDSSTMTFGVLKNAQALGDNKALLNAGRQVIRFHLESDIAASIEKLTEAVTK